MKILKILAEIENPDKIVQDCARQILFLAREKAQNDEEAREQVEYYLDQVREQIDKLLKYI